MNQQFPTDLSLAVGDVCDAALADHSMDLRATLDSSVLNSTLMIVDDQVINIKVLKQHLKEAGYEKVVTTNKPTEALNLALERRPDLLMLDIVMPELNGLELLRLVRQDPQLKYVPILMITANSDPETKLKALDFGASDFLSKPVDVSELLPRVRNLLFMKIHQDQLERHSATLEREVRLRTAELTASQQAAIRVLARAAELRDNQTDNHIICVGRYAAIIASKMGFGTDRVTLIEQTAQLHDVGKIGIPDRILGKRSNLSEKEQATVRKHCHLGMWLLREFATTDHQRGPIGSDSGAHGWSESLISPVIRLGAVIAQSHHEKWDGSGYPCGLLGDEIPIEGRIVAVADMFDEMSRRLHFQDAVAIKRCFDTMKVERGQHFDPQVLDAFIARKDEVVRTQIDYADRS